MLRPTLLLRGRSLGVVGLAIGVNPVGNVVMGLVATRFGAPRALAGFAPAGLSPYKGEKR